MRQPDDYSERAYPTRTLPENIRLIGGTLGWSIFLWMFHHPFDGYVFPDNRPPKSAHWWPNAFVRFLELGIIAMNATDTGYTLTAQGRLWVAEELEQIAKRRSSGFFWSSYTESELAMLDVAYGNEIQPFDLSEF